jgi:gamma-glutamylcyclotransferase (GGCT)/AIG2-like uncharacterized protein YtfP
MENLFSYGTLQYESVQMATFGRQLKGSADQLIGYALFSLPITDEKVIALSGESVHKILRFTGNPQDIVNGRVFEVTQKELDLSDQYEVDDYQRVSVTLSSGLKAWAYVE